MFEHLEYELEDAGKWISFANDYFAVSLLLARESTDPKHLINVTEGDFPRYIGDEKVTSYPEFFAERLYFPMLFNFKHGIEIALKSLVKIFDKENNVKDDGHNLRKAFKRLKNFIEKFKIIKYYEDYKLSGGESDFFIEFVLSESNLPQKIELLERLIIKYQSCDVVLKYLNKNYSISDKQNDAFRYPENQLNISMDYMSIKELIKIEDVYEILEDIVDVKNIFGSLGELLSYWSKNKKSLSKSS